MRNRFEQQLRIGIKPISETPVLINSRDDVPALVASLLKIFNTPEYNEQIFSILERCIMQGKKKTGRQGLNLWQIFVLAQFRLALNLDYDRLHYMTTSDSVLRQLLGIEAEPGFVNEQISYQRILDNVHLLTDKALIEINNVIVNFGHNEVFKKKETDALSVKTDSFVVGSNVHFPTDYNLLLDSVKKVLDIVSWFSNNYTIVNGWRKASDWFSSLKSLSREVGQISSKGGKNKKERLIKASHKYITKSKALLKKVLKTKNDLPLDDIKSLVKSLELDFFLEMLEKHIDLVERRIIKGETIDHKEKIFSIFETYTEWITKGKKRPSVELGKKLSISADQYGLIIDFQIMENESDSQIVIETADRVLSKYKVKTWSFDKGYSSNANKELLSLEVEQVIMPKKGKRNKKETEEESSISFKKLRKKHSAIESRINELEHSGLDRCPDKGYPAFKRYVALGVIASNLKRIGCEIIKQERKKNKCRQIA